MCGNIPHSSTKRPHDRGPQRGTLRPPTVERVIDASDIAAAHRRIVSYVRRTPLLAPGAGSFGLSPNIELTLKLELFQHTGSFKSRGAFNCVLAQRTRPTLLAAASGGNHGQAVAFVGRVLQLPATIFVPTVSSPLKQARIAAYGATLNVGGALFDDAQEACSTWAASSGAFQVHPFDDEAVIAGQGTVALELAEQLPNVDTVLVATGGGGLIAGIAAFFGDSGRVRVVSVEPEGSNCLAAALHAGHPTPVAITSIAADSLGAKQVGALPFAIAQAYVHTAVLVGDDAIVAAQHALWEETRIAAEPGGATALAGLMSGAYRPEPGERVAVLVCGGNVDPATLR